MDFDVKSEAKKFWKQENNKNKITFEVLSRDFGQYCYLIKWDILKESSLNISEQEMENLIDSWFS
tara:strand:+ start:458 stop:652 length:195 start_codon:yes stop_codon:yes gene_type:complete